jgi:pimeloyl-ACP methyl ester carboxylesterase
LPGHYPATFPAGYRTDDLTAESMANVITAALHQLIGRQPAILVGHSTGGFAALDIAVYHPKIVAGVISISGFAQGQWSGILGMNQRMVRWNGLGKIMFKAGYKMGRVTRGAQRTTWKVHCPNVEKLYAYPYFDSVVLDSIYANYKHLDLDSMVIYFEKMPDIDISPLLSKINVPVLALTGDIDPTVSPAQAHLIAEKIPNADLAVIEGGIGHMPFFEAYLDFQRIVSKWLNQKFTINH